MTFFFLAPIWSVKYIIKIILLYNGCVGTDSSLPIEVSIEEGGRV